MSAGAEKTLVSAMGKAALGYARAGFAVFPCKETGDKARGSKLPYTKHGFHDASRDAGVVGEWWARWPHALVGFPTGPTSGALVVDLDAKQTPTPQMLLSLRRFADFRDTPISRTQSDGLHVWFAYPGGDDLDNLRALKPDLKHVGNRAGLFGRLADAPGALAYIDVRGEGGYVIAPPSRMDNGRFYEWLIRPGAVWKLPLPPRRLLTLICGIDEKPRSAAPKAAPPPLDRVGRYVSAAVNGVCATARAAPPGERNQVVFECARRLSDFVRGGQLTLSEAEALLLANLPVGVSAGEKKIKQTIRNGLEGGTSVFEPGRGLS